MKNYNLHHDADSLVDPHLETLLLRNAATVLLKVVFRSQKLDEHMVNSAQCTPSKPTQGSKWQNNVMTVWLCMTLPVKDHVPCEA